MIKLLNFNLIINLNNFNKMIDIYFDLINLMIYFLIHVILFSHLLSIFVTDFLLNCLLVIVRNINLLILEFYFNGFLKMLLQKIYLRSRR
jgi:hypothetical protein